MSSAPITKAEVVPLLLEACPTAVPAWEEHLVWWDGKEERGGFNDVNVFARHIVESYARGVTTECEALFATVERILNDGNEEARSLAALGVFESLKLRKPRKWWQFWKRVV